MLSKKITLAIAISIILFGVVIAGVLTSQKEELKRVEIDTKTKILTQLISNSKITKNVQAGGTVRVLNKIEIYAEVSGILEFASKEFREGNSFSKGDVLLKINDAVTRNKLLAEKSSLLNNFTTLLPDLTIDFPNEVEKWKNYLKQFNLRESIKPLPEINSEKEKYYIAAHDIFSQYYSIKSNEETLAKYRIRAPFNGVVTSSNIIAGTLVRTGQELGEFVNLKTYEIPVNVSVRDISSIKIGQQVELQSSNLDQTFRGTIKRINSVIDKSSQTVLVYIQSNEQLLKDGMYVIANIKEELDEKGVTVSKELLFNNNTLYVVEDSILVLKEVKIKGEDNDKVFIAGLPDGTEILSSTYTNAKAGINISEL